MQSELTRACGAKSGAPPFIASNTVDVAGVHAAQPTAEDLPRQLDVCSHECALAQYILKRPRPRTLLNAMQHKPLRAAATAAHFRRRDDAIALPPFTKVEGALGHLLAVLSEEGALPRHPHGQPDRQAVSECDLAKPAAIGEREPSQAASAPWVSPWASHVARALASNR